jgi:hypothetical protein
MSKIMDLMKDKDAVLVFDVDGVLAAYEYGEYHHNACRDEDWPEYRKLHRTYEHARPLVTLQNFLAEYGNSDRTFVCSQADDEDELNDKMKFVTSNYPIKAEHVYIAKSKEDKLNVLKKIHDVFFPDLDDKMIVMIDDTAKVLTNIQDNSGYSTAHITSFVK